jgi:tRNA/tmRNA/rRNA uracil-C5-methylase (TrmA/RlmC/RlmD family)
MIFLCYSASAFFYELSNIIVGNSKKRHLFQFAGIGYFTLSYLVHAKARFLHACDWNADALEALQRNLAINGVDESRYKVGRKRLSLI